MGQCPIGSRQLRRDCRRASAPAPLHDGIAFRLRGAATIRRRHRPYSLALDHQGVGLSIVAGRKRAWAAPSGWGRDRRDGFPPPLAKDTGHVADKPFALLKHLLHTHPWRVFFCGNLQRSVRRYRPRVQGVNVGSEPLTKGGEIPVTLSFVAVAGWPATAYFFLARTDLIAV